LVNCLVADWAFFFVSAKPPHPEEPFARGTTGDAGFATSRPALVLAAAGRPPPPWWDLSAGAAGGRERSGEIVGRGKCHPESLKEQLSG
jgi:hypothetical protein